MDSLKENNFSIDGKKYLTSF